MQDSITTQMPEEADNHNGYTMLFVSIQTGKKYTIVQKLGLFVFFLCIRKKFFFYVKESICTIFERYSANNKQLYIFKVWGL